MANKTQVIRIESILGGHSPFTHFAAEDQFLYSSAIDPEYGLTDIGTLSLSNKASGLIRPIASEEVEDGIVNGAPMWLLGDPEKSNNTYLYDAVGSVYTVNANGGSITPLGDLNDGGDANGNGAAYYDNYVYFARDTTIARYGPLDGTAVFTDDYWVSSLGKTALADISYPLLTGATISARHPTHILHRHSDGKLYILDLVGNQATLHYIQTTKTTVAGDTDAGSKYDAISFGENLYPTAIESYGEFLVISFYEGSKTSGGQIRSNDSALSAKIAFWDTTSDKVNKIIWVEYPDPFISAIKNTGGVLNFVSSNGRNYGFRVLQYLGGDSFQEIFYSNIGNAPHPGAVDAAGNRMIFGSKQLLPDNKASGCVYQLGSKGGQIGNALHNIASTTSQDITTAVTALRFNNERDFHNSGLLIGWAQTTGTDDFGVDFTRDTSPASYGNNPIYWLSQIYKIGQPFKITKIRIPLARPLSSSDSISPSVWIDGIATQTSLTAINSTNYGTSTQMIVIRPNSLTADHSFCLELRWNDTDTSTPIIVSLPIIIEYEFLDIDSSYPNQ